MNDTLSFNRNKFVGIEKKDENTFLIFGTLEDNLYSHEIECEVDLTEMKVIKIKGHMRRFTTPLCPPAAELLQKAVDLKIKPGFTSEVKRKIARPGCRHFGNLLNECINSIVPAIITLEWRSMKKKNPELTRNEFFNQIKDINPLIQDYCIMLSKESPLLK